MALHARIDVNLPKDKLIRRAGYVAELLYIRGILLAKETNSDGEIDDAQLSILAIGIPGNPRKHAQALIDVGLWQKTDNGWRVPLEKWAKYQLTAAEVEDRRKGDAERQRQLRSRHRHSVTGDGVTTRQDEVSQRDTNGCHGDVTEESRIPPTAPAPSPSPPAPPLTPTPPSPTPLRAKAEQEQKQETPLTPQGGNGADLPKQKQKPLLACDLTYPPDMDSPEVREAMHQWLEYRRKIKKPLVKESVEKALEVFAPADRFIAAVDFTIAKGWQGLKDDDTRPEKTKRSDAKAEADRNYRKTQQMLKELGK